MSKRAKTHHNSGGNPDRGQVMIQNSSFFFLFLGVCVCVLRLILSPLHNLSSMTKRAALTAHFVTPCINCRPKATKCAAVHGTFCRPREREREREREFIMLLKVISLSPQKKHVNQTKICNK